MALNRVFNINAAGPVIQEFFNDDVNFIQLIRGPVGSGKTTACLSKLLYLATVQTPNREGVRPTRWGIVRRTYSDLTKTTASDWQQQWKALGPYRNFTQNPLRDRLRFSLRDETVVEVEVEFVALDREEDVERIRGGNFTGFFCNELKQLHLSHLETLVARSGRYPSMAQGGVMCDESVGVILGDTNAPDDDHWLYVKAEKEKPDGWAFYVQPPAVLRDGESWIINPNAENKANLPDQYYERLLSTLRKDKIQADLANEYTHLVEGKPVYPEYSDNLHCSELVEADPNLPIFIGADGGLSPAVVICQLSPRGQLRILDELVGEDIGVKQFWRDVVKPHLRRDYHGYEVAFAWFDPAGNNRGEGEGKSAIRLLNDTYDSSEPLRLGFSVEAAATNDIDLRLDAVRSYLNRLIDGAPALLLHPRCKVLRAGFLGKYSYRKLAVAGVERYVEKPDKGPWSHAHDSCQYACLGALGGFTDLNEAQFEEVYERRNPWTGY